MLLVSLRKKGLAMVSPRVAMQLLTALALPILVSAFPAWSATGMPVAAKPDTPAILATALVSSADVASTVTQPTTSSTALPEQAFAKMPNSGTASKGARLSLSQASKRTASALPRRSAYTEKTGRSRGCSGDLCPVRMVLILGIAY